LWLEIGEGTYVVLAISEKVYTTSLLQAKAEAILWASLLVVSGGWDVVDVESDSKSCIDALRHNLLDVY
jgi:uncharacterized protein YbdZ (MbtH family)